MSFIDDWGSTPEERAAAYPCDAQLRNADYVLHRAVSIDAPPSTVFRWLCQLRVAPYSYDWIDNSGQKSPETLNPKLQQLAVGQRVMRIFRLLGYTPHAELTIRLDDSWGQRVFGEVVGTYRVVPHGDASRLVVRLLAKRANGVAGSLAPLLWAGDLLMMRRQLLNLKRLAERTASDEKNVPTSGFGRRVASQVLN
jgi:hypothetical protein